MSLSVTVLTIPHSQQEYPTPANWKFVDAGILHRLVTVSEMQHASSELAVAIHELVEMEWCLLNGVSEEEVTAFDTAFECERAMRIRSLRSGSRKLRRVREAEPGDDPRAPYRKGHELATQVERLIIEGLGIKWKDHGCRVLALDRK